MSIEKTPNGRFRAHLKSGRVKVATRTFDTRREAVAWLTRERAALDGGIDPRAGKERVRDLLPRWLEIRRTTVAAKTWQTDRELLRLVPTSMMALQVSSVRGREVARSFEALLSRGLGHTSVVRYRASLSVFFAWWVREKLIATNPVTAVRVPKSSVPPVELHPFTEDELEAVHDAWALRDPRLADVMLVLGWTGLRWAEARELRVGDFVEVPSPALLVRRSAPEGVGVKATKSGRSRRVPVANRVLPIIKRFTLGLHGRPAAPQCRRAHPRLEAHRPGPSHPRPAPHRRLPLVGPWRRPGDRAGMDGPRVDRHHEPLPAPPGHRRRHCRSGKAQCQPR